MAEVTDPRRCAACASYRPVAADPLGRNDCTSVAARDAGTSLFPLESYGCVFWVARDPAAYKALVIRTALQVLYVNVLNWAGRTALPQNVDSLDWATLARLEATALRLVQAFGLLP